MVLSLESLFEDAPDAYLITDLVGRVLRVNRHAESLFGHGRESIAGRSLEDFVSLDTRKRFRARVEALATGRASRLQDWQVVLEPPDQRSIVAEVTVESTSGDPPTLRWLLRDVTERRSAEEALRHGMARLRALLESAVDGIIAIDSRGRIELANPAVERIFGWSVDEILGENVKMLMPEPYHGEHDDYLSRYLHTGERKIIGIGREVTGQRKDGSVFPMDLAVSEVRLGERRSFVGIVRDLTPRKQLEEQVRQAQKLEAIGQLAGGVAHDFNTLLGSITGYSEMLLERLAGDERGPAEQIHRAAERGAALTRQLLAFGRRQVLQPRIHDLNRIVTEIDTLLRRLVGEDVRLLRALAPEPLPVRVDANQMEQVIMNLVVNARDAMPRGGTIHLRTRRSAVGRGEECRDAQCEQHCAQLLVSDTGEGMDEATRERIFEPFFTTKEPGKGTGLGLSTVYGIVAQSQGAIQVRSTVGEGTTFVICLPLQDEEIPSPVETKPASPEVEAPRGEGRVLLVEDDSMFRGLLEEVLGARGYTVWAAADPHAALERLEAEAEAPDLLVSDMVMPGGLTGSDLARELVGRHPDLRVLLMSGYTEEELTQRGGVDDGREDDARRGWSFIHKPFGTRELVRRVRALLGESADGDADES